MLMTVDEFVKPEQSTATARVYCDAICIGYGGGGCGWWSECSDESGYGTGYGKGDGYGWGSIWSSGSGSGKGSEYIDEDGSVGGYGSGYEFDSGVQ